MNVWSDLTLAPEIKNRHLSGIYNFWSFCEVPIDRHPHSCNIFQQKVITFLEHFQFFKLEISKTCFTALELLCSCLNQRVEKNHQKCPEINGFSTHLEKDLKTDHNMNLVPSTSIRGTPFSEKNCFTKRTF